MMVMMTTETLVTVTQFYNCGCGFTTRSVEAAKKHVANTEHKMEGLVRIRPAANAQRVPANPPFAPGAQRR